MEIKQVKETCIYVNDLDETQNFYQQVLDLPVIDKRPGRHVFFRAGTSVLLCFIAEVTRKETDLPPHFSEGPAHLAFEVSVPDYIAWRDKVVAAGVKILHDQPWGKDFLSFYFEDPDGHLLEIVQEGMWD